MTEFLRRDEINKRLVEAGMPYNFHCHKRIPAEFGLPGETETNIIFDTSTRDYKPIIVLGWGQEALDNAQKFIKEFVKSNRAACSKRKKENLPIQQSYWAMSELYSEQLRRYTKIEKPAQDFWSNFPNW